MKEIIIKQFDDKFKWMPERPEDTQYYLDRQLHIESGVLTRRIGIVIEAELKTLIQ